MIIVRYREGVDGPSQHYQLITPPGWRGRHPIPDYDGGLVPGSYRTLDQTEAETQYFALARLRSQEVGVVTVQGGGMVADAIFRTDLIWQGRREQEMRHDRLFALNVLDIWLAPTPEQVRGLLLASRVSQTEMAGRLGVAPQHLRRWTGGRGSIPQAAWMAMLVVCGYGCHIPMCGLYPTTNPVLSGRRPAPTALLEV